jgi:hypothetical protein
MAEREMVTVSTAAGTAVRQDQLLSMPAANPNIVGTGQLSAPVLQVQQPAPFAKAGAPATAIEITPEMIEAGQIEFALSEGAGDDESIAAVYVAMEQARRLASGRKRRLPGSRRRSPE